MVHTELTQPGTLTLDLLTRACAYWLKRHAFLRAKVHRRYTWDASSKKRFLDNEPRYFVPIDADDPFACRNVDLILTNNAHKWKEQVEVELTTPLDMDTGPLWRLKVIQLLNDSSDERKSYTFVFLFSHVCTDGKNNVIFIELLNIVNALLDERECVEMREAVESPRGLITLFREYIGRAAYVRPDLANSYQCDMQRRQLPLTLGNTLNGSVAKVAYVKFDEQCVHKLMAKMKQRAVKMNGLFEAIYYFAYRRLLIEHGETELARAPLQYIVNCGGRDKLAISYSQMGLYNFILYSNIHCQDADMASVDGVWPLAERQTRELHERLRREEEVEQCHVLEALVAKADRVSLDDLRQPKDLAAATSVPIAFVISNTGVFENTHETTRGLKATEIYCAIPSYSGHVFMRLSTINGTLCLTLSYNERVFSNAFMRQLTHAIVHVVNQLCE